MDNYVTDYEKRVLDGDIEAGRKLKKAIRRDQKDLRRSKKKDFPYYFNQELADKAINFVELLPTTSGDPLKLEPFQKWLLGMLFGWRKKSDDTRRFSECFISFSRKNGKSFLMSCIASLYLLVENRPRMSREILFTANTFKQAKIAFDMFASGLEYLAKKSPTIRKRIKINNAEVFDLETNSHAICKASNTRSLDGYKSDLCIVDEFHLAPSNEIKNILKTGQVNSDNALLAIITTSGTTLNGPCYKDYLFASRVLDGEVEADDLFIAIYEQDSKAEVLRAIDHPEIMEKSNPLLSNADRRAVMLPKLVDFIKLANEQKNLLPVYVKNANLWLQARENSYITARDWQKATIEPLDIKGLPIWFGVDLSKSGDLTSVSWIIPIKRDDGSQFLYCDSHSWVGTKYGLLEKEKRDHFNYTQGEKDSECSITKSEAGVINYDDVLNFMIDFVKKNRLTVQAVCYDPWSFDYLINDFERLNWQLVETRQGRRTLSIPTRTFREELFKGNIKHPDNKLLAYAVNNAIITYDRNQNMLIDKSKSQNKIDPLAALMNAYSHYADDFKENKVKHDGSYFMSDQFSF
ncbi:terminase large subunit [Lactobacillus kitasatonis]|uniref:terminase large subunit n=1 Tax=Lactobacillus kitasatonis TaxID=237446 RepID=UPI003F67BD46